MIPRRGIIDTHHALGDVHANTLGCIGGQSLQQRSLALVVYTADSGFPLVPDRLTLDIRPVPQA